MRWSLSRIKHWSKRQQKPYFVFWWQIHSLQNPMQGAMRLVTPRFHQKTIYGWTSCMMYLCRLVRISFMPLDDTDQSTPRGGALATTRQVSPQCRLPPTGSPLTGMANEESYSVRTGWSHGDSWICMRTYQPSPASWQERICCRQLRSGTESEPIDQH